MKKIFALTAVTLLLNGCGNTSLDNEAIGQAKKFMNVTPLVCMNYPAFDLSLGIMQNGTGSISKEDIWFTVVNYSSIATLKKAVETGAIVKVHYDVRRLAWCSYDHWLTGVEIQK